VSYCCSVEELFPPAVGESFNPEFLNALPEPDVFLKKDPVYLSFGSQVYSYAGRCDIIGLTRSIGFPSFTLSFVSFPPILCRGSLSFASSLQTPSRNSLKATMT
jgi:hypothetical protein